MVQSLQQGLHHQFLCSLYGIAPTACLLVGRRGKFGTGLDEGGVIRLFKTVLLKMLLQIEVVVRQFFLFLFVLVHVYFGIIVVNTKCRDRRKKHSGYPSRSATTKSKVNQSSLRRTRTFSLSQMSNDKLA